MDEVVPATGAVQAAQVVTLVTLTPLMVLRHPFDPWLCTFMLSAVRAPVNLTATVLVVLIGVVLGVAQTGMVHL